MFLALALPIAVLLHVLIARRLARGARPALRTVVWFGLSFLLALMLLNPIDWALGLELSRPLRTAAYVAMGLYSFVFTAFVARELIWFFARPLLPADLGRRELLGRALNVGVFGLAGAGAVAGYREAQRRARIVKIEVPLPDLPAELDRFRVVQISDLHIGPTIDESYVRAIADAVDRLDADVIAVTGDVVDGKQSSIAADVEPLARMKSKYGTYLCTGNHEYYSGAEDWIAEFRRLGIHVLLNEHRVIEHRGKSVLIGGVTDPQGTRFVASHVCDPKSCLASAPECDVRVLLAHRPKTIYESALAGFHLQLSGHTHGGQFFPWNLVARLVHEFPPGLVRHRDAWLYTSRGTGYFGPPFRLGAPSEITVLELVKA